VPAGLLERDGGAPRFNLDAGLEGFDAGRFIFDAGLFERPDGGRARRTRDGG
jgi:hypothetical protein